MIDGNGVQTDVADPEVAETAIPEEPTPEAAPETVPGDGPKDSPTTEGWRSIGGGCLLYTSDAADE